MGALLIDGPLGTELAARGVPTPLPGWSAHALETAPEVVAAIHRDYADAGATVHTTNTFRTREAVLGARWEELARIAVRLVRDAVPAEHRVAGSIAPLEDCYRPDLSPVERAPEDTRRRHGSLARVLAEEGCDLLLCETFPHPDEALVALDAALATGLETWLALTPGPAGDLLAPEELAAVAARAVERGASAVLVNCLSVDRVPAYLAPLLEAAAGRALAGAYGNAGWVDDESGWKPAPLEPGEYAAQALEWVGAGAAIVGSCCGTHAGHVAAMRALLGPA